MTQKLYYSILCEKNILAIRWCPPHFLLFFLPHASHQVTINASQALTLLQPISFSSPLLRPNRLNASTPFFSSFSPQHVQHTYVTAQEESRLTFVACPTSSLIRCFIKCGLGPQCYDAPNTIQFTTIRVDSYLLRGH